MKTKESLGKGRGSVPVHRLINQHPSCSISCNGKGPWRWRSSLVPQTQKGNNFPHLHTHILIPGGLRGLVSWYRWRVISYKWKHGLVASDSQWVRHCWCLPFPQTYNKKKRCLLLCHQDKIKENTLLLSRPWAEKSAICSWHKTPTMCLLSTNRQHGSRGRNSLQSVFVLTKAFIAKVQELTSLDRQGGGESGPREITTQMHTQCTQSLV